jgi:hypothetical protein
MLVAEPQGGSVRAGEGGAPSDACSPCSRTAGWWRADEYVSVFLRGYEDTPDACHHQASTAIQPNGTFQSHSYELSAISN